MKQFNQTSQKIMLAIQITKASLLICFFFILWYLLYEQNKLFLTGEQANNTETLTEVHLSSPSTLSSNITLNTINNNDSIENPLNELKELNKRYCGNPTCKFLFVYNFGEQETKANLHFRSFSQLAEKLNQFPNVLYKSEDDFILWLKERDQIKNKLNNINNNEVIPPLSILHSNLRRYDITSETIYRNVKPVVSLSECLSKFGPFMNLTDPNNSRVKYTIMDITKFDLKTEQSRAKFSKLLIDDLSVNEEILLVNSYVLDPLFPVIMPVIPYNDYILNEAQKLKEKLSSSYIGIHWRLEQSRPELLPECAQGLIITLNKIMKEEGIENIYLATDYPLLSSSSQSDTFTKITNYHHDAIRMLNETFKINTWVSLGGLEQLRKNEKYDTEFIGPGIQGILDKLVCVNSNYFIAGPKGCSRILSTFTKAIADERSNRLDSVNSKIETTSSEKLAATVLAALTAIGPRYGTITPINSSGSIKSSCRQIKYFPASFRLK
ncbi:9907_t:CDS:2 [Rhizophagus irregularis]|nr:9907_t:CDS:2 [Rhizophagus irregularis]